MSDPISVEGLCASGELETEAATQTAKKVVALLRKIGGLFRTGRLRDLSKSLDALLSLRSQLESQLAVLAKYHTFDLERLLSEHLAEELGNAGRARGLSIVATVAGLHFFPYQVKVLARDRAVLIGKHRETDVRPSVLIARLHGLATAHPAIPSAAFLEVLFQAYQLIAGEHRGMAPVVPLVRLYKVLTLRPGTSKDYPLQDFARDVYLLDRDGPAEVFIESAGKHRISFAASTGTKLPTDALSLITEKGLEKRYYGIAFVPEPLPTL